MLRTIIVANVKFIWCLLVRFPNFRFSKSMFMLINAEMTPKTKILGSFTLYVTFAVVLDQNLNF